MPWLKVLHLSTVIVWCGALLYLPLAIAGARDHAVFAQPGLLRGLYIAVATPAALVAIASGTLIFLLHGPIAPWLIAKLGSVAAVVLVHAALGILVLRREGRPPPARCRACGAAWIASATGLSLTAWLVLAKPPA